MWKLSGCLFLSLLLQIAGQDVHSNLWKEQAGLKQGRIMIEQIFVLIETLWSKNLNETSACVNVSLAMRKRTVLFTSKS